MRQIPNMQIETEDRRAGARGVHQGFAVLRHQCRRVHAVAGPDRRNRHTIGEIQRVQDDSAHVAIPVSRQRSAPCLYRIEGFQTRPESKILDDLCDLPGAVLHALAVLIHQDDVS